MSAGVGGQSTSQDNFFFSKQRGGEGGVRSSPEESREEVKLCKLMAEHLQDDEVEILRTALRERQREVAARSDSVTERRPGMQSIRTLEGRLLTFGNGWPHAHHITLLTRDLAAAGFFFTPTARAPDRVTCAYCGLELGGWDDDRDVASEAHLQGNPACPFLSGLVSDDVADDDISQRRAAGAQPELHPPQNSVWNVRGHVDRGSEAGAPPYLEVQNESVSNDVRVENCAGSTKSRQVTVDIRGATPKDAIRSLLVVDCAFVRILVERVILKVVVANCEFVQVVLGGNPPPIVVKNTRGCTLTLCPDDMDHEIECSSSAGVALQAVPRALFPPHEGVVRPQALLQAVASNEHETVLVPEQVVTEAIPEGLRTRVARATAA